MASAISFALVLGTHLPARAHLAAQEASSDPPSAAFDDARALHRRATSKYETYDFDGAIDLWTQAYERIEGHPRADEIRQAMSYNLANAHVQQFNVDADQEHLELAKLLLARYQTSLGVRTTENEAEHARVEAALANIATLEADRETAAGAARPDVAPTTSAADADPGPDRRARGLVIGGGTSAGVGAALLAVMAVGLARGGAAQRDAENTSRPAADLDALEARGRTANRLAIGTGAAAGALLITGAVLLAIGLKRGRKRPQTAHWSPAGVAWRF